MVSFSARRGLFAAAGCIAVLLAGCNGGAPEGADINTSSDTPASISSSATPSPQSSTPTPTASAPALPAAAKQNSDAGVRAFIGYYFDVLNYGIDSTDWEPLNALSHSGCAACKLLPVPASKGRYEGAHWAAGRVSVFKDKNPQLAAAKVTMSSAAGKFTAPQATPTSVQAQEWVYQVDLVRKGDSWQVLELHLIAS